MERLLLDLDDLRERYLEGISEKALAETYDVSRNVIALRLRELGVERRGRGAAMSERMRRTPLSERSRITSAAHAAIRGRVRDEADLSRRARGRQATAYFASPYERVLADWLAVRGLPTEAQKPVGRYNLDLAVGSVAVELHRVSNNPARCRRTRERAHYLLDRGWSVIYVWARPDSHFDLSEASADEIVAFAHICQTLPAGARQYWVIRGSGERVLSIGFDPDQAASIPSPEAHSRIVSDY